MKAFLLAGGQGTRLRPLTDTIPKCLVPIQGGPLLDIWLDQCARSSIREVLINLHAHSEAIEQHLKQRQSPVNVRLVHEERLLGSAGTLAANRAWVGSDSAFWILYSDVLTNTNLKPHERVSFPSSKPCNSRPIPGARSVALWCRHHRLCRNHRRISRKAANPSQQLGFLRSYAGSLGSLRSRSRPAFPRTSRFTSYPVCWVK